MILTSNPIAKALTAWIPAAVSLIYIWAVLRYSVNMPFWDDYQAIVEFLTNFYTSDTARKFQILFGQHNEHRIVFNRMIELLQFELFGEINFLYLIIIGNIGWFALIYWLWKDAAINSFSFSEFSPVLYVLLSFSHWSLMIWAMGSIQQYYQLLFALLAIWSMTRERLLAALGLSVLSIFTGGGGLVLIPLFILYYFSKHEWRNALLSAVVGIASLITYFVALPYEEPAHRSGMAATLSEPFVVFFYFLAFLGGSAKAKVASIILGAFCLGLFAVNARKIFKHAPFYAWSIVYLLGSAALTSLARSGFGLEQALESRYSIYSLLMLSLLYLTYVRIADERLRHIVVSAAYILSLLLFAYSLFDGVHQLQNRSDSLKGRFVVWDDGYAKTTLLKSFSLGFFQPLTVAVPTELHNPVKIKKVDGGNAYCVGISKQLTVCSGKVTKYQSEEPANKEVILSAGEKSILIDGWSVDSQNQDKACGVVALIGGQHRVFDLAGRPGVVKVLKDRRYYLSGFSGLVDISRLSNGIYTLEIRTVNSSCNGYYESLSIPIVINN